MKKEMESLICPIREKIAIIKLSPSEIETYLCLRGKCIKTWRKRNILLQKKNHFIFSLLQNTGYQTSQNVKFLIVATNSYYKEKIMANIVEFKDVSMSFGNNKF